MTKQISLTDLAQVKKYMGLTFSVHDGEALSALRKVNSILKKHALTWDEVLSRTVKADSLPIEESGEMSIGDQIRKALDLVRSTQMSDSFAVFLSSIEAQYEQTGYLTPEQRRPLFAAAKRQMEKMR